MQYVIYEWHLLQVESERSHSCFCTWSALKSKLKSSESTCYQWDSDIWKTTHGLHVGLGATH